MSKIYVVIEKREDVFGKERSYRIRGAYSSLDRAMEVVNASISRLETNINDSISFKLEEFEMDKKDY